MAEDTGIYVGCPLVRVDNASLDVSYFKGEPRRGNSAIQLYTDALERELNKINNSSNLYRYHNRNGTPYQLFLC